MKVLLPQPIESEAVAMLTNGGCEVITAADLKAETIGPLLSSCQGIVLRTGIAITRELLADAGELMVISRTGGGFDNVDIDAATEKGVIVTSNLGVNTVSVFEHVLALMLALSKRLPELDRAVRTGDYRIRYKNLSRDISGKTLGLLGFGRIGLEVASNCARMFNMQVLAFDPYIPDQVRDQHSGLVTFVDKDRLLAQSDFLSIHVPLTAETRHSIGASELAAMKKEAILINTSRGPVIDEAALTAALESGSIGGAGLDVQEKEPPDEDNPLLTLDNVILTPHSAALTGECVIRMATEAAVCVLQVFNNWTPNNVANPEVLKRERWQHLR